MAATFPDGSQVVATDVSPAGPIVAVQTPNGVTQWHHPDDFTPEDHAMLGTGGSTGGGFAPGAPMVDPGGTGYAPGAPAAAPMVDPGGTGYAPSGPGPLTSTGGGNGGARPGVDQVQKVTPPAEPAPLAQRAPVVTPPTAAAPSALPPAVLPPKGAGRTGPSATAGLDKAQKDYAAATEAAGQNQGAMDQARAAADAATAGDKGASLLTLAGQRQAVSDEYRAHMARYDEARKKLDAQVEDPEHWFKSLGPRATRRGGVGGAWADWAGSHRAQRLSGRRVHQARHRRPAGELQARERGPRAPAHHVWPTARAGMSDAEAQSFCAAECSTPRTRRPSPW